MTDRPSKVVSIIIVNYNTRDLTKECLSSVYARTKGVDFDVYVVDNASSDGSADEIARAFPAVKLIRNEENAGFARANNMAMRASTADYVFLLNSDTILVNNAVGIFFDFMEREENAAVGCCGGSLYDRDMAPQVAWGNLPSLKETAFQVFGLKKVFPRYYKEKLRTSMENRDGSIRKVGYIVGADMFIRRRALDRAGLFDEDFFLYFEDTELSFRMGQEGFASVIIPDAEIIHLAARSSSGDSKVAKIRLREKSRLLFFRKCYGKKVAHMVKILYITKQIQRLLFKFNRRNLETLKALYRA